jgi:SAM-dependent methyltransferase
LSRLLFTGERLHEDSALFGVDLVRHRAAYAHAIARGEAGGARRTLDLGCGTGYGAAELAAALPNVFAIDRISPDREARPAGLHFIRADLNGIPLAPQCFDLVVSFQVIEHLEDPSVYLETIGRIMAPGGVALITTPNLLTSDRENPFHVHEYAADELARCLGEHFEEVEMLGITATPEPMAYYDARLRRIRSIVRIDPLGLRRVLPRKLIDWLFGRLAVLVRRGIQSSDGLPDVTLDDFPVVAAEDGCLDLLAVCRRPRARNPSAKARE